MKLKVLLCGACLIGVSAAAHHAAPAFYDLRDAVVVEGTITAVKLANPHTYYRVTTEEGVDWAFESAPSWTALAKLGWTEETIPRGARVRVSGAPALSGKRIARYLTIAVLGEGPEADWLLYRGGRDTEWPARVGELGRRCSNGIEACTVLDAAARRTLRGELGADAAWSGLLGAQ